MKRNLLNRKRFLIVVGISLCLAMANMPLVREAEANAPQDNVDTFNPKVVIKKKFPSIRNVAIRSLKTADNLIEDDELVLGVVINNQARAYAINMLNGPTREIINDDLSGESIAATW